MDNVGVRREQSIQVPYPSASYAWFVVAILIVVSLVSNVDRHVVALLVEPMQRDLEINDGQVGWLFSGFAIFYAVCGLPLAYVADRSNRCRLICIGIILWSIMTILSGLARNYSVMLASRIGVGVGEASLTPAAHSLVGDYFPRERIPLAIAVFQMSSAFGTGLAYSLGGIIVELVRDAPAIDLGPLGEVAAWRMTFFYVGIPGFFVLLLMMLVREPTRRHTLSVVGLQGSGAFDIIRFYRKHWAALTLHHLGYGMAALVGVGIIFWTPTYFQRVHGIPAGEAGTWYGLYFMVFATAGTYCGARLGGRFLRAGHHDAALRATIIGASAMIPIGLVVPMVPDAWMAWVLYAPLMFLLNVPFGLGAGSLPVIVPNRLRAQAAALYTLAVSGLGMGMGPVVVGTFNDLLFPGPDGVRLSLALLMLVGGPVWILLLQCCRPHYIRAYDDAESLEGEAPRTA